MKISDIMTKDVQTVSPDAALDEVAKKMQQRDCGCVVVVKDDRMVGMITDRDITLRCIAEMHDPSGTMAKSIMTHEVLYCRDTDDSDAVARLMGKEKVRRLAVLDADDKLVGIVSLGDLATHTNYDLCGRVLGEICRSRTPVFNEPILMPSVG